MSRQVIQASIVFLALIGADACALGLGGLRTESALNQPFLGEINLFDVKPDELDTVKAALAPAEAFAKAGIERYHFLTGLVFEPEVSARGDLVIRITSREPIREPFMDFLVEVVWPAGQMVKEFTVLLDPPSMSERRAPAVQPPAIADRRAAAPASRPRSAERPVPAPQRSDAADRTPPPPAPRIPSGSGGFPAYFGPVPSGAGLLRLARAGQTAGATTAQTALALYRNNQDAFIGGDIDRLIAGKTLVIPTRAELYALDEAAAATELQAAMRGDAVRRAPITEVARIHDAEAAQGARLRIAGAAVGAVPGAVPGTDEEPSSLSGDDAGSDLSDSPSPKRDLEQELLLVIEASESARQETEELRGRVRELETQLADIQTLLQLRNAELARLQVDATGESVGIEMVSEGPEQAPDAVAVGAEGAPNGSGEPIPEPASDTITQDIEAPPVDASAAVDADAEPIGSEVETDSVAASDNDTAPATVDVEVIEVSMATDPAATSAWHDYLLPLAGFAAVTAVGVLLLSLLSARRRRRGQDENEEEWSIDSGVLDFAEQEPPPDASASGSVAPGPVGSEPASPERRPSDAVVRSPADAGPAPTSKPGLAAPEPTARDQKGDSGLLTPSSQLTLFGHFETETDEVDALSEADIYIAYGRYKEAEDLLKRELKRSPERLDVRFKLAEVYAGSENPEALRKLMQHLKATGADTADPTRWQRLSAIAAVVEQGGTWDPGATMPMTEATGIPAQERGPDLASSERAADSASGEAREDENDFFRLDLGELEFGPRPVPTAGTATPSSAGESSSPPTQAEDLPLLFDDSALDSQLDLPELSGVEDLSASSSPRARDRQSGYSEESDLVLTLDDLRDSGDLDLDAFLDAGPTPVDTPKVQSEEPLPSLTLPEDRIDPSAGDMPGSERLPDVLAPRDDELSDQWAMDSGIWDENATKLDLARAYIDMDDVASARDILREVIADGREEQRNEAQDMLRTLA
jgi:pilus assembly protein FimV